MAGRYEFSLPEPRGRDGWFRIGSLDMSTTACVVGLGLLSMVLYAFDPVTTFKGAFVSELVRHGEVWRMVTWPVTNPPTDVWALVGLAVFWFLGHLIEDEVGRVPFTFMLLAMAIVPTALVTILNIANETGNGRWFAYSYSVSFFSIAMISIYGIDKPHVRFFFGIPAWVIAAAYVLIEVLRDVGNRAWAQLILVLLVVAVGCIGARQRGMLEDVSFIPRIKRLSGSARSPYGEVGGSKARRPKRTRGSKGAGRHGAGASVVSGPWGQPTGGPTPLEQAELDVLLDKIGADGIDSLTPQEKARLNDLSKRMRDS